jgi:hypothetical protein
MLSLSSYPIVTGLQTQQNTDEIFVWDEGTISALQFPKGDIAPVIEGAIFTFFTEDSDF